MDDAPCSLDRAFDSSRSDSCSFLDLLLSTGSVCLASLALGCPFQEDPTLSARSGRPVPFHLNLLTLLAGSQVVSPDFLARGLSFDSLLILNNLLNVFEIS